jgi:nucleoside-diphosphate-sugar epimerase
MNHILVTGGAGYVGSSLAGMLLTNNYTVTVVDNIRYGLDGLLGFLHHPNFKFVKGDIRETTKLSQSFAKVDAVVHLAAIVGYPACNALGDKEVQSVNEEGLKNIFRLAEQSGCKYFIYSSTYSNYGVSPNGCILNEDSPLKPQSLYAETKIAGENYLLDKAASGTSCVPVIHRFATVMGISPRTRFDLLVNQFALEAYTNRKLVIFQKEYRRSFVHVKDVARAIIHTLEAPTEKINSQIINIGSNSQNYTKLQLAERVSNAFQGTAIEIKNASFDGDMRDIRVSFDKIKEKLGFECKISLDETIEELYYALENGLFYDPSSSRHRNVLKQAI